MIEFCSVHFGCTDFLYLKKSKNINYSRLNQRKAEKMSNIGQFHDEAEEAKDIILKKKESYRVEIRRRKLDETLSISR